MGLLNIFSNKNIKLVKAYEVLDSRGYPTVACEVTLSCGAKGKAMVPSGASTGIKEALELRDGNKKRYNGKGVLKAIQNINRVIGPQLIGKNATKQKEIDEFMIKIDSTPSKTNLGANAILAVSLAVAKAAACANNIPLYAYLRTLDSNLKNNQEFILPVPMLNVINGGAHADNTIDFQEFMFMPVGATNFANACQIASECFHSLGKLLKSKGLNTSKGDEGGYAPLLKSAEDALDLMVEAIKLAGYKPGINSDVAIALDCAASELYDEEKKVYVFKKAQEAKLTSSPIKTTDEMIDYLISLTKKYPIISIEDGLAENDWKGFIKLTSLIGNKVQIVGDDLYCTNPQLAKKGIDEKASNAVLIKLNQIGTLTETIETIKLARYNQQPWAAVISHRSGETEDTFIADLAVGLNCGQIKTGSMSRSERICKYNRLLEIENELTSLQAKYEGIKSFKNLEFNHNGK